MTRVTLQIRSGIEERLREKARRRGQTLEAYLEQLAEREAETEADVDTSLADEGRPLSDAVFDQLLDELSTGPRPANLPDDFSRADIYADHD
jgi:hypothetical protein